MASDDNNTIKNKKHWQTLEFNDNFENTTSNYKLLELSEDLLKEINIEQQNLNIFIKGSKNDEAVFCSSNKTFTMKLVECSNSILLIPDLEQNTIYNQNNQNNQNNHQNNHQNNKKIESIQFNHYELIQIKPKLENLKNLLKPFKIDDSNDDNNNKSQALTFEQLSKFVQCSDFELKTALLEIGAREIKGHWYVFDEQLLNELLEMIVATIIEQDQSFDNVDSSKLAQSLNEYPIDCIEWCLDIYSTNRDNLTLCWSLDFKKIAIAKAIQLLSLTNKWPFEEFERAWRESLPQIVVIQHDWLKGLAIFEDQHNIKFINYFPVATLPTDPRQRFSKLFDAKSKWTKKEIEPYLLEIIGNSKIDQVLAKFTRMSNSKSGESIYTSRF
eukprot:TRINITY_DN1354_c0_g1_i1.p1 TRINITY_DN1354_c0_g1~~TRINITY_DN1354_c0_g1_i1.p1  ORF type:complete len:385 (-),score=134.26 TRINITY_DN1354_c0_g1_i1:138-1292(-)